MKSRKQNTGLRGWACQRSWRSLKIYNHNYSVVWCTFFKQDWPFIFPLIKNGSRLSQAFSRKSDKSCLFLAKMGKVWPYLKPKCVTLLKGHFWIAKVKQPLCHFSQKLPHIFKKVARNKWCKDTPLCSNDFGVKGNCTRGYSITRWTIV